MVNSEHALLITISLVLNCIMSLDSTTTEQLSAKAGEATAANTAARANFLIDMEKLLLNKSN